MSYEAQPAQHNDDASEDRYPSLADIARDETDGGRLVVRFLVDAMRGQLEDAKPCHQLDAARQLLKLGMDDARIYVARNGLASNNRNGHSQRAGSPHPNDLYPPAPPSDAPLNEELADFIRLQTEGGKAAVRFLVNVMHGNLDGFKPHHRLSAAKELLRLCRDNHYDGGRGDDDDYDDEDDGYYYDEDEDEETYPHGIGDALYQAYKDDPQKLDEALKTECSLYSAYKQRKGERAAAKTRPDDDDHDEETYPSDTLHTIYDTYKDDPDKLLEAIKRELAPYNDYKEGKEARAAGNTRPGAADHRNDDSQRRDHPEPPPPDRPTPPAASTEEPEASEDPPWPQEPEEPRPTPADPPTGPSYYEREAMRKGVDTWRDPADYWVSADANPPGSYYPASGHIDFTALPRGP